MFIPDIPDLATQHPLEHSISGALAHESAAPFGSMAEAYCSGRKRKTVCASTEGTTSRQEVSDLVCTEFYVRGKYRYKHLKHIHFRHTADGACYR